MIGKDSMFKFITPKYVRFEKRSWYPAADIYDAPDGWVVKVELAGISLGDFKIQVQGNKLYLSGNRRDKTCCLEGVVPRQVEITYSRFERTLVFPEKIENMSIGYEYQDGLLYIYLKKEAKL